MGGRPCLAPALGSTSLQSSAGGGPATGGSTSLGRLTAQLGRKPKGCYTSRPRTRMRVAPSHVLPPEVIGPSFSASGSSH